MEPGGGKLKSIRFFLVEAMDKILASGWRFPLYVVAVVVGIVLATTCVLVLLPGIEHAQERAYMMQVRDGAWYVVGWAYWGAMTYLLMVAMAVIGPVSFLAPFVFLREECSRAKWRLESPRLAVFFKSRKEYDKGFQKLHAMGRCHACGRKSEFWACSDCDNSQDEP